jgi:hypothetical protein
MCHCSPAPLGLVKATVVAINLPMSHRDDQLRGSPSSDVQLPYCHAGGESTRCHRRGPHAASSTTRQTAEQQAELAWLWQGIIQRDAIMRFWLAPWGMLPPPWGGVNSSSGNGTLPHFGLSWQPAPKSSSFGTPFQSIHPNLPPWMHVFVSWVHRQTERPTATNAIQCVQQVMGSPTTADILPNSTCSYHTQVVSSECQPDPCVLGGSVSYCMAHCTRPSYG